MDTNSVTVYYPHTDAFPYTYIDPCPFGKSHTDTLSDTAAYRNPITDINAFTFSDPAE